MDETDLKPIKTPFEKLEDKVKELDEVIRGLIKAGAIHTHKSWREK